MRYRKSSQNICLAYAFAFESNESHCLTMHLSSHFACAHIFAQFRDEFISILILLDISSRALDLLNRI